MGIIGRSTHPCHWCGFEGVHVKRNDGKRPYEHCPSCGRMTPTKNGHQEGLLMGITRPESGTSAPPPAAGREPAASSSPTPSAPPAPPAKPRGFWDQLARSAGDA